MRDIFRLYLKHHALTPALEELARRQLQNKSWKSKAGRVHSGRSFTEPSLRRLLTNATYVGKVEHRGVTYTGEHPPILDANVWDEVNSELRSVRRTGPPVVRMPQNALLAGVLFCGDCQQPMVATYTSKRGRRFRYYVCQTARRKGWSACPTKSVPVAMIEDSVIGQIRTTLSSDEARAQFHISTAEHEALEQILRMSCEPSSRV